MSKCMAISLETSRHPCDLCPWQSTTTKSSGSISPLLIKVGVQRMRPPSRRTERLPSVAATNPVWWSSLPNWTISSLCCCSVFMQSNQEQRKKKLPYRTAETQGSETVGARHWEGRVLHFDS